MNWRSFLLMLSFVVLIGSFVFADTLVVSLPPGEAFLLAVKTAPYVCPACTLKLQLLVKCTEEGFQEAGEFVVSHPEVFEEHSAELVCNGKREVYIQKAGGEVKWCEVLPGTGLNCD